MQAETRLPQRTLDPDRGHPLLRRVQIRNYKSIGKCDVSLSPFTMLVGRNGAGKSNFLDALRFAAEALETSLDQAVRHRGGIKAVRRESTGHPRNVSLAFSLSLPNYSKATYGFELTARSGGTFAVKNERLSVTEANNRSHHFRLEEGRVRDSSVADLPDGMADRLSLVRYSAIPEFRSAYDALLSMGFYNLNPDVIRQLQSPHSGGLLHRDGGNLASVIGRLANDEPDDKSRIEKYLGKVCPEIEGIDRVELVGPKETLVFRQRVKGAKHPWKFYPPNMSDGTLRALGILAAVLQRSLTGGAIRFVGIEEPEIALHPAASGALMGALEEAAISTQICLTTHSPDLLDHAENADLLAVEAREGQTHIAPIDTATRESVRDHLFTAGELLRMDQFEPDEASLKAQKTSRTLFDELD